MVAGANFNREEGLFGMVLRMKLRGEGTLGE